MIARYHAVLTLPHALGFMIPGYFARWPMAMRTLGCVLLIQAVTGSYGIAGLTSAVMSISQALAGPFLARFADRNGQRPLILTAMVVQCVALTTLIVVAETGGSRWLLPLFAIITGVATPPITSLVRRRWTAMLRPAAGGGRPELLDRAFAFESMLDESVFILGPLLVTTLVVAITPPAGLIASMLLLVAGSILLARQRVSEPPRGVRDGAPHIPAIRLPGIQVLIGTFFGAGIIFGSVEVSMVAFAREHDTGWAAGVLLALYALGSFIAALIYGARDWSGSAARRMLGAIMLMFAGTIPVRLAPNVLLMGVFIAVAGLSIAPSAIASSTLTESLVPPAALTEGFAWTSAATVIGLALGTALSGVIIDHASAREAFLVSVAGGAVALLVCWLGMPALRRRPAAAG